MLAEARAAGADVGAAVERDWGGYTGYFADPDGVRWEIAWNPGEIGQQRAARALGGLVSGSMTAPSGDQFEIAAGGYRAVVTECGATLRVLEHDGRPLAARVRRGRDVGGRPRAAADALAEPDPRRARTPSTVATSSSA